MCRLIRWTIAQPQRHRQAYTLQDRHFITTRADLLRTRLLLPRRRDDPRSVRRRRFARRLGLGRRRRLHWLDELGVATGGARLIFTQRAVVHATGVFGKSVHDAPVWDPTALASWAVPSFDVAAMRRRADSPIAIFCMVGGSNVRLV